MPLPVSLTPRTLSGASRSLPPWPRAARSHRAIAASSPACQERCARDRRRARCLVRPRRPHGNRRAGVGARSPLELSKPRGEAGESGIDFTSLRAVADLTQGGLGLLRLAIETRKDQMEAQRWFIRGRDDSDGGRQARDVEQELRFPRRPAHLSQWQRMLLEDLLVIDAPTLVPGALAQGPSDPAGDGRRALKQAGHATAPPSSRASLSRRPAIGWGSLGRACRQPPSASGDPRAPVRCLGVRQSQRADRTMIPGGERFGELAGRFLVFCPNAPDEAGATEELGRED